jgi:hypothetical protein
MLFTVDLLVVDCIRESHLLSDHFRVHLNVRLGGHIRTTFVFHAFPLLTKLQPMFTQSGLAASQLTLGALMPTDLQVDTLDLGNKGVTGGFNERS